MKEFKKNIDSTDYHFKFVQEGRDEVFLVHVEGQNFRMIIDDDGNWGIWQQVPAWIIKVEKELGQAIDEHYQRQS
jgi:hypothetical protein